MPATQNHGLTKGYDTSSAIVKNRFVKTVSTGTDVDDALEVEMCDAQGEKAVGVSVFSVSDSEILRGKGVTVVMSGIAVLEASEAIAAGDPVTTGADGRAENANSGDYILGECREPAGAEGNECSVILTLPAVATKA